MKTERIKNAAFNNRRKVLTVEYASGKKAEVHYGQIGIRRNLEEVWIDRETRGRSLGLRFADGSEDYMPYDQPLALTKDPQFMLRTHLEKVIARINEALAAKRMSKRHLARQLGTSDNQVQRLLNPAILNKNLEQLYRIGMILGLEFEWHVRRAARGRQCPPGTNPLMAGSP